MGYKAPAVHRQGTYTTDCDCKHNQFRNFREAKQHAADCVATRKILYGYERRVVWERQS